MVEFFTILSASLGAATTVTKLATQLSGVRDETGTVVDQIRRINEDIILARHLRYRKKLNLADRDAARIDRIVKDTENAVLKIAQQVERTRVGVAANGTVNLYDRFDWVLRRSAAVTGNQQNLQTCHHSLLGEISYLRQKESIIAPEPLSHLPPPYEDVVQTASKPAALWTTTPDASSIPYKDSSENENENEDEDEDEDGKLYFRFSRA